jgi:hypothetical protein
MIIYWLLFSAFICSIYSLKTQEIIRDCRLFGCPADSRNKTCLVMQEPLPSDVTTIERKLSVRFMFCRSASGFVLRISKCDIICASWMYKMKQRKENRVKVEIWITDTNVASSAPKSINYIKHNEKVTEIKYGLPTNSVPSFSRKYINYLLVWHCINYITTQYAMKCQDVSVLCVSHRRKAGAVAYFKISPYQLLIRSENHKSTGASENAETGQRI